MDRIKRIRAFWGRQRWIMPLCFLSSVLMTGLGIAFCILRGFDRMPNTYTFTMGADIISLCVCTVLLFSIVQDRKGISEHTRIFVLLITSMTVVIFSDLCCWIVQGEPKLRSLNIASNVVNYTSAMLMLFFMFSYVADALEIGGWFGKVSTYVMNLLLLPIVLACLANAFYPLFFSVDAVGLYHRTSLFPWSQTYLVVGIIMIIIGFFVSKKGLKEKLIYAVFVLIPVANQVITGYTFGLNSGYSAMLISIVLVFGVVVAKHEQALIETQSKLYEAKVNIMVSQVRPHFMYNALSSIAMLCKLQPDTAYEATITFADYLRGNMDSLKQTKPVPFEKELDHLKKYLYIEKLRFQDKLNIEYDIEATDFKIPLLSIQPLVENAVKHGVGMKEDGGTVTISSRETEDAYEVIIADDGVGFDPKAVPKSDEERTHIGMDNTKERLKEMCEAEIKIDSEIGKGTTVRIILPKSGQEKGEDE